MNDWIKKAGFQGGGQVSEVLPAATVEEVKVNPNPNDLSGGLHQPLAVGLEHAAPLEPFNPTKYRSDPLPVDWVDLPTPGRLGMTLCPGRGGPTGSKDKRQRHLGKDLDQLQLSNKAKVLVTLIEAHEFPMLQVPTLIPEANKRGITVEHFPIKDVNVPTDMAAVHALVQRLNGYLDDGQNVVIHCRGGLGRTGTIAACMLVARGWSPQDAIDDVRKARPKTLETSAQEQYVFKYAAALAQSA
jgi:protein-tyrosine phosphatase